MTLRTESCFLLAIGECSDRSKLSARRDGESREEVVEGEKGGRERRSEGEEGGRGRGGGEEEEE